MGAKDPKGSEADTTFTLYIDEESNVGSTIIDNTVEERSIETQQGGACNRDNISIILLIAVAILAMLTLSLAFGGRHQL